MPKPLLLPADYRGSLPILRTSERTLFRKCRQAWWWGYRRGLTPKGPPGIHFWFGTGIHEALASHYQLGRKRGRGANDPRKVWEKYCADEFHIMKTFEGDFKEYYDAEELGAEMLENYLAEYGKDDHMDILATEQVRFVTIFGHDGEPLAVYAYTMDGVYRDLSDHNKIKILEHKTAGIISVGHLQLDDQAGSYPTFETMLLQDEGILKPNQAVEEMTYNFLRKAKKKIDDRPTNLAGERLNKDGTVSKQQKIQEPLFRRYPVGRSRETRLQILDRIIVEVEEMNRVREDPERAYKNPHPGPFGCVSCVFKEMCELHEEGGDWGDLRDWKFKVEDPYQTYRKAA